MSQMLEDYLTRVMVYANLPPSHASEVRQELRDHLLEKIKDLKAQGLPEEDAVYQAINAHGHPRVVGYGLRPRFPLVDIRSQGTARGVIAIGPKAVGIFAVGGTAIGVFACGGLALGLVAFGGLGAALLFAFCGMGAAPVAYGGVAVGLTAAGGAACGAAAVGGFAVGLLAEGGRALSAYNQQNAPELLKDLLNLWGNNNHERLGWVTMSLVALLLAVQAVAGVANRRERRRLQQTDPWLQE
jgi:hypothetical protein